MLPCASPTDTPIYVREIQEKTLAILAPSNTIEGFRAKERRPWLLERRIRDLARGEVDVKRLIVEQFISRTPEEVQTRAAIAARQLRYAAVPVHPGESVGYIITNAKAKIKAARIATGGNDIRPDVKEFVKLLREAVKEICPFSAGIA